MNGHKKQNIIVLIILFFACILSCIRTPKYRVLLVNPSGIRLAKTQKQMLKNILSNIDKYATPIDKRGKIRSIYDISTTLDYNGGIFLPDSLIGLFKITRIVEKMDNYQLQEGKVTHKSIYLIDIENINDTISPKYMRLISINSPEMEEPKIEIGETYEMKIYSLFYTDCCISKNENGEKINIARKPDESGSSYFFEDIWAIDLDIGNYNLFETPNLKGLYYIKSK